MNFESARSISSPRRPAGPSSAPDGLSMSALGSPWRSTTVVRTERRPYAWIAQSGTCVGDVRSDGIGWDGSGCSPGSSSKPPTLFTDVN